MEMEDKPYSVDSSDDINIEEEEEHIEENHSECLFIFYCSADCFCYGNVIAFMI